MTDPRLGEPADVTPVSSKEAAGIVQNDDALQAAAGDSMEDAATDDDARTADTAPVGDQKTD